jgi:hypothetical protein
MQRRAGCLGTLIAQANVGALWPSRMHRDVWIAVPRNPVLVGVQARPALTVT